MTDLTTLLTEAARAYEAVCQAEGRLANHCYASGDSDAARHAAYSVQHEERARAYRARLALEPTARPDNRTDTDPTCIHR